MSAFASVRVRNHSIPRHSSRKRPLKLSFVPFCQGFPGSMKAVSSHRAHRADGSGTSNVEPASHRARARQARSRSQRGQGRAVHAATKTALEPALRRRGRSTATTSPATFAIDFLTVPTATFGVVYVFFVVVSLEHRLVLHANVTAHPYALGRRSRGSRPWRWTTIESSEPCSTRGSPAPSDAQLRRCNDGTSHGGRRSRGRCARPEDDPAPTSAQRL
jgi:hypothetical protein